ncbi:hypothetical protein C8R42DRAFT_638042 [Lentinula raphanica]|nr:hypothetical protein C8R42DRAFT_638042 [Lentinula raphanica]
MSSIPQPTEPLTPAAAQALYQAFLQILQDTQTVNYATGLTFPMEYEFVWNEKFTPGSVLYLFMRYGNVIEQAMTLAYYIWPGAPFQFCKIWFYFDEWLAYLVFVPTTIFMGLRTFALYRSQGSFYKWIFVCLIMIMNCSMVISLALATKEIQYVTGSRRIVKIIFQDSLAYYGVLFLIHVTHSAELATLLLYTNLSTARVELRQLLITPMKALLVLNLRFIVFAPGALTMDTLVKGPQDVADNLNATTTTLETMEFHHPEQTKLIVVLRPIENMSATPLPNLLSFPEEHQLVGLSTWAVFHDHLRSVACATGLTGHLDGTIVAPPPPKSDSSTQGSSDASAVLSVPSSSPAPTLINSQNPTMEEWELRDGRLAGIIYQNIKDLRSIGVTEVMSAHEMWSQLTQEYDTSSAAAQSLAKERIQQHSKKNCWAKGRGSEGKAPQWYNAPKGMEPTPKSVTAASIQEEDKHNAAAATIYDFSNYDFGDMVELLNCPTAPNAHPPRLGVKEAFVLLSEHRTGASIAIVGSFCTLQSGVPVVWLLKGHPGLSRSKGMVLQRSWCEPKMV